jgi:hypothetical protein
MDLVKDFNSKSKVWIYQADRPLTEAEINSLTTQGDEFVKNWTSHQQALKAALKIIDKWFVFISVDEDFNAPGGCSIDKSIHFMQQMGGKLNVDFFNRINIAAVVDEEIKLVKLSDMAAMLGAGVLSPQSIVYNNSVSTIEQWRTQWQIPLAESFLKRYLQIADNI